MDKKDDHKFDVYTEHDWETNQELTIGMFIDNGDAIGLIDGFIDGDNQLVGTPNPVFKNLRESQFPLERILKAGAIDIKKAVASEARDEKKIKNTITNQNEDDDPPEFIKERNFIIPTPGGGFLSIPYPLGLNILPGIGRLTTEFVLTGGKNPTKKVGNLIGVFADGLSPIGSAGALQTIAPTVLDPVAALSENKDAFGRPIYKKDQATNPTPGYARSRENASEISKQFSYFLNMASGGGKYSKGLVSPTADEIDYVVGQVTGGVGRELMKTGQTLKAASTGEDLPAYRIPLAGRFYGETESNAAESQRFYTNVTKMADYENEVKGRIKNKEPIGPYLKENPQARLWKAANSTENQINALNKQKKEFIERGLPKERIKRIENQKAVIMKRFNDQVEKLE
jgi:hypothetical protein